MAKGPKPRSIEELFWPKVARSEPDQCWPWLGYIMANGYGRYQAKGTTWWVHRLAYTLTNGPIPAKMQLDHLCRNRACCNPAHLEPVSQRENILRGEGISAIHARQTHCIHGHEFTPANTRRHRNGGRGCRSCDSYRRRVRVLT